MPKKEGIVKKAERYETHHRIAFFVAALVGAIVVTRIGVWIHFPNHLTLDGTELHHFDYGLAILLVVSQLSLFGPRKFRDLYIFLTAVSSGLILDEYWMLRHGVEHMATPTMEYNSTIISAAVVVSAVLLCTLFIDSVAKRKRRS